MTEGRNYFLDALLAVTMQLIAVATISDRRAYRDPQSETAATTTLTIRWVILSANCIVTAKRASKK